VTRVLLGLLILVLLIVVSYFFTSESAGDENPSYREFMYYPLVAATLLMELLALAMTANSVALERQKGTWESLQITLTGAETSIRTRWALVFYRLRWVLLAVVIGRIGFVVLLLKDLTDFEGRAIDVRIIGISPEVTLEVAVFLIAGLMTAAILQPLVSLGFYAALGMVIATVTKRRNVGILMTVFLMMARVVLAGGSLYLGSTIMGAEGTKAKIIELSAVDAWIRTLLLSIEGDLSLRLLNLETLGNLWADIDNGIYLGGVMLLLVLVQAVVANLMLLFAAWRSYQPTGS
jgi:hypothetical protein